ncbi:MULTISPECIES: aldo/keto reductase [unclassified Haladaptatus]|uniref:aldo/keto reductase n=1 Tax=unclassified Haladaptatus TaxID=2622732 RepID=UPI0023E869A2|nr:MULTISPECIES: aldo/keto reductase [unclassified Haladaptatus]
MEDEPEMPRLGLGTYDMKGDEAADAVETAIDIGYRHIDTAQHYDNEEAVGRGIARADVPREDLFVATKIWHDDLGYDDVIEGAQESLDRLGLDYIDLLYVHWPAGDYDAKDTLAAFDELYEEGVIRHVGVSNFTTDLLDEAQEYLDAPIFAHQVECHPLLQQRNLRIYAAGHDIELVAYSPIARNEVAENEDIKAVAENYDATPAQISLAWLLANGIVPIPKSSDEEHLRANYESLDIELTQEDKERLDNLDDEERLIDPDFAPW